MSAVLEQRSDVRKTCERRVKDPVSLSPVGSSTCSVSAGGHLARLSEQKCQHQHLNRSSVLAAIAAGLLCSGNLPEMTLSVADAF